MSENRNSYCYHCFAKVDSNAGEFCAECGKRHSVHYSQSYELPAGTLIGDGRYIVGESIGSGGFGITYVGFDLKLEKKILVKETFYHGLFKRNVNDIDNPEPLKVTYGKDFSLDNIMRKTKKECVSLSEAEGLNNIVKVYDWFSENNTAYIITEFINGVTLDERVLEKGCYSWEELYQRLKPLMKSLEKLHKKGIIHRDIKPQNIMIKNISDDEEEFVLIDFGLARSVETGTLSTMGISFSPGYSPIEQRSFNVRDGSYTDVYALAATIYFALTGETPSCEISDTVEGNFPLINSLNYKYNVPDNVIEALKSSLALDYRERCNSISEFMWLFEKNEIKNTVSNSDKNTKNIKVSNVQNKTIEKDNPNNDIKKNFGSKFDKNIETLKVSNIKNKSIGIDNPHHDTPKTDLKKHSVENTEHSSSLKSFLRTVLGKMIVGVLAVAIIGGAISLIFVNNGFGGVEESTTSSNNRYTALVASGDCGDKRDNIQWELYESNYLYILGNGEMDDYDDYDNHYVYNSYNKNNNSPWFEYIDSISYVKIELNVTTIGNCAFANCESLEEITISRSIITIGDFTFYNTGLKAVTIPDSVTTIKASAFDNCTSLTKMYFKGDKPNLDSTSFKCVKATVYYPKNNSTWDNIEENWDGGGEMTFVAYDP